MRLNPNVSGINVEKTRRNSTGGIHDMYEQGSSLIKEGMHLFGLLLLFGKKSGVVVIVHWPYRNAKSASLPRDTFRLGRKYSNVGRYAAVTLFCSTDATVTPYGTEMTD